MEIIFYQKEIRPFLDSLHKAESTKVARALKLLRDVGHLLRMPHVKKVSERVFELRIEGKISVRLFYTFSHSKIYILHGFVKKSQDIPEKELRRVLHSLTLLDSDSSQMA